MMLIAVTYPLGVDCIPVIMYSRPTQPPVQPPRSARWLLVTLFAAAVITGLLGMHTFSTTHADVFLSAAPAGATSHAEHMHHSPPSAQAHPEADCGDCGQSGSHHAMAMACVLGLLVTLVLVCRARPSLVGGRGPSIVAPFLRAASTLLPRPPSLIVLSISRT